MRFITGSSDNTIYDWIVKTDKNIEKSIVGSHADLIRDVAWAPNVGMKYDLLASASESIEESVKLWKLQGERWECF